MSKFKADVYLQGFFDYAEYQVPATINDDGTLTISAKYNWFIAHWAEGHWFICARDPDGGDSNLDFLADSDMGRELIKRGLVYTTQGVPKEGASATFDFATFDELRKARKLPDWFFVEGYDDKTGWEISEAFGRVTLADLEEALLADLEAEQAEVEGEATDAA